MGKAEVTPAPPDVKAWPLCGAANAQQRAWVAELEAAVRVEEGLKQGWGEVGYSAKSVPAHRVGKQTARERSAERRTRTSALVRLKESPCTKQEELLNKCQYVQPKRGFQTSILLLPVVKVRSGRNFLSCLPSDDLLQLLREYEGVTEPL